MFNFDGFYEENRLFMAAFHCQSAPSDSVYSYSHVQPPKKTGKYLFSLTVSVWVKTKMTMMKNT